MYLPSVGAPVSLRDYAGPRSYAWRTREDIVAHEIADARGSTTRLGWKQIRSRKRSTSKWLRGGSSQKAGAKRNGRKLDTKTSARVSALARKS